MGELRKLSEPFKAYHFSPQLLYAKVQREGLRPKNTHGILNEVKDYLDNDLLKPEERATAERILEKTPEYIRNNRLIWAFPEKDMKGDIVTALSTFRYLYEVELEYDYYVADMNADYSTDSFLIYYENYVDSLIPISEWDNQYETAEVLINHEIPPDRMKQVSCSMYRIRGS